MRALAISDTHGDYVTLNKILMSQSKAEVVFFLGDGADDIDKVKHNYPEKMFISVRGNCDWGCELPIEQFFTLEGKKIMSTHGHAYDVKFSYNKVINHAIYNECDILLFGHTHTAIATYEDGLYIMNPGSAHGYGGTYGTIDITPQGIVTNIVKIK